MAITIIISSPHSLCPKAKERLCDLAAGVAARKICEAAKPYIGREFTQCIYFPSDEFRTNHDLNRTTSRETSFRKSLRNSLRELGCWDERKSNCPSPATILLDIHSFPNYYMKEAGDINFFKEGEVAPDIVLIKGPLDKFSGRSISHELSSSLVRIGLKVKILSIIPVNDIMEEADEYKIPAVLIEVNEKYASMDRDLNIISEVIIGTLTDLYH